MISANLCKLDNLTLYSIGVPTKETLSSSLSGLPSTDPSSKKKGDKGSKGSSKKVRASITAAKEAVCIHVIY